MQSAIPSVKEPEKFNEFEIKNSGFVNLSGNAFFEIEMKYPKMGLKNAISDCYVRQEVAERLILAQNFLPQGIRLKIWDAWRPFSLQLELYEKYSEEIISKFGLENKNEGEQLAFISKFVSYPEKNENSPPVHTTGGAVDVTLIDSEGIELLMGTEFDEFSEKTQTDYYEKVKEFDNIRQNRRLLYNCMTKAGFTNLPSEWWHFDFGDKFWGYYKNLPAFYGGIFDKSRII